MYELFLRLYSYIIMEEIYKEHPYLDCLVSNKGNVIGRSNTLLKGNKSNYRRVAVYHRSTNEYKLVSIHRMVVETFIKIIPQGMYVNHIDGNKLNNNVDNLEIVTPSENCLHSFRMGLSKPNYGMKSSNAIINDSIVLEIYELIRQGASNDEIASKYNMKFRCVSLIRNGSRWKHLFDIYMKEIIPSPKKQKHKDNQFCFEVLDKICNTSLTNIEISKMFKLEPSLVSRVRYRKTWKQLWSLYDRRATTIPQGSTL